MQLQIDADEFWPSLQNDIRSAREYIYIQTMSFEGDTVGKALSEALAASAAPERRIIADEFYTRHRINDRHLHNPKHWFNSEIRRERDETVRMMKALESSGVRIKLTNPSGPLLLRFLDRNHKKIVVIDDRVAYIGGFNFTEHNFEWHDMMLRIADPEVTRFLKQDFLSTWEGQHVNTKRGFDGIEIYRFDGRSNGTTFRQLLDVIGAARESIYIASPYVTYPFFDALVRARDNGVRITIVAPEINNWRTIKEYVIWEAKRLDLDLRHYQGRMSHLKGMLIDDEYLIIGSSNFDFLSYQFMQEIVAVVTDSGAIGQFKRRVMETDLRRSVRSKETVANLKGLYHIVRLKMLSAIFLTIGKILFSRR